MSKQPVTEIPLKGVTIVAEEGYTLEQKGDTVSVVPNDRYVLHNGTYSQHFKDTKTGKAVSLERVLHILNGRG